MSTSTEPIDAATVVVSRDTSEGIEVLMLRRNSRIYFGGMWVFPGGRVDAADRDAEARVEVCDGGDGRGFSAAAIRETREESDCVPIELVKIFEYFNSPGTSNEKITLFCGRVDASCVEGVHGLTEEHEDIEVVVLPFEEALAGVESGLINNAMSIIALQWLKLHKAKLLDRWH